MSEKVILGVIPARGGSKGIPGKNLQVVANTTLVEWAIKASQAATKIDTCIVSTNDTEIAAVCEKAGGNVPFLRPAELALDTSPTSLTLKHAIEWYESEHGRPVFAVLTLQPTAPFRSGEDIDTAIDLFLKNQPEADSLISVCSSDARHPLTLYWRDEAYLKPFIDEIDPNTRRQNFSQIYWRNGAIYITRRDLLFERERVVSNQPLFYEMPVAQSANIDELIDLEIAEVLFRHWNQS